MGFYEFLIYVLFAVIVIAVVSINKERWHIKTLSLTCFIIVCILSGIFFWNSIEIHDLRTHDQLLQAESISTKCGTVELREKAELVLLDHMGGMPCRIKKGDIISPTEVTFHCPEKDIKAALLRVKSSSEFPNDAIYVEGDAVFCIVYRTPLYYNVVLYPGTEFIEKVVQTIEP
ncbi:MAG: hypothetical protein HUJ69_08470 [Lachnospiraceae bacterium]|nr:hypothetical protein [Lachnospiraceae bacterium]